MNCVRPPLPKKPSRGFAWACGPCSRAQEKKLEARHTPQVGTAGEDHEEEIIEEEEEEPNVSDSTRAASLNGDDPDIKPPTEAELAIAKMWPMRYLGIHCRVEDVLDYDDCAIYPRASSRLGPRHQTPVSDWPGQPFELVKPVEIKKKFVKGGGHKKESKFSKDTLAAIDADRVDKANRPKWVVDEPAGYVARGEDYDNDDPRNTAQLIFKMPEEDQDHSAAANEDFITNFMQKASGLAKKLRVSEYGVNLMDKALSLLIDNKYDAEVALDKLDKADRGVDLKEPILTHDDLKKFEDGVSKYGSEHRLIKQHMKGSSLPISAIVRFYYLWKKTSRGKQVWGSYGGRKSTHKQQQTHVTVAAHDTHFELGDDVDDSAFDSGKAVAQKKEFQCKFCSKRHSSQWRRAPGITAGQTVPAEKGASAKDKASRPLWALCLRCAGLWRRYAIQWEEQDEVARKVAQGGGKAWKRRIDEELLRELQIESNMGSREASEAEGMTPEATSEPAKKKARTTEAAQAKPKAVAVKQPTPPPPPIVPDPPQFRSLPCFVCKTGEEETAPTPITCTHCKLTVHKHCYGLSDQAIGSKWVCDQCTNDRAPLVSTDYVCTLCPIEFTPWELWEPPKLTHKKKSDRDKEKERLDKDLLDKAKVEYTKRQTDLNRPVQPREPLKKTDGNNWVHVLCSVWTPEIKFSSAKRFERAEGFSMIPTAKYETMCKLCKNARHGACVSCQQCHANFHVACAFEAGYTFGFDVTPVKGSRKDQVTTVSVGAETGHMTAAIWCLDHSIKTIVHPMDEVVDEQGTTALQLYVENYKQADQTLTGTARKANLLSQSVRSQAQAAGVIGAGVNRRVSTVSVTTAAAARKARNSIIGGIAPDDVEAASPITPHESSVSEQPDKKCVKCGVEVSPKWWPLSSVPPSHQSTVNGILNKPLGINGLAQESTEGKIFECHKCHHKTVKPTKRIPLSPKPFNINLEWPPCLSVPPDHRSRGPSWNEPPVIYGRPGDPRDQYSRPPDWSYPQHPQYQQAHVGGHLPPRQPLPPPPNHGGPQTNGGYPYGHPEAQPPPPHMAGHQPNGGGYLDRAPPLRAGPPPPTLPPSYGPPPTSHPPPPPLHQQPSHHMSPHHSHHHHSPHIAPHQSSPLPGPSTFAPRSTGSPFHHAGSMGNPNATPIMPPRSSPALAQVGATPVASGYQPSTPKPPVLETTRPGASNSPHIGNLLS
ncbi:hypothetical protein ANO11243_006920 [Dothideomycetidae sp. 11243]|nr:hypothetical protein ANO11243_006920 [fungal sp. No.11243]